MSGDGGRHAPSEQLTGNPFVAGMRSPEYPTCARPVKKNFSIEAIHQHPTGSHRTIKSDTNVSMTQESGDRRQFLKAAGAAALTSSFFTGNLRGANDRVNVAFIGVGRMGTGNIGYAAKVPGIQIVSVCDVYQPALEKAQASITATNATVTRHK